MTDQNDEAAGPDGLPPLRSVIASAGLSAKKALGQNFLLDLNLTRRIARSAAPLGTVLEIGPGPGGLTRALLLEGAEKVVAIERDARCIAPLEDVAQRWQGRLELHQGDALELDHEALAGQGAQIVANLPYNVGTELVIRWLRSGSDGAPWWRRATIMLQREVAQRLAAEPGDSAYGRLAVLMRWRGSARILFDVSPKAFSPPPKVTSSIIQLTPTPKPQLDCALEDLERVSHAAFTQRRKMLRRSLRGLGAHPHGSGAAFTVEALLEQAQIDPTRRAETLSPEEFALLARIWRQQTC